MTSTIPVTQEELKAALTKLKPHIDNYLGDLRHEMHHGPAGVMYWIQPVAIAIESNMQVINAYLEETP